MYCGTAYYIFKLHIRTHIYVDAHIHIVQLRMQTHKNTHKYTPKVYAQTYMRADSGGGQAQCYYQLCGAAHTHTHTHTHQRYISFDPETLSRATIQGSLP
jgi:hypothetical protein